MHRAILLFGYPGSGKGTQGQILAALPGFHHVAMGDIFRRLTADNPHYQDVQRFIRAGDLVSDELVIKLFEHELSERKIPEEDFLVIDGAPRNRHQVNLLNKLVTVIKIFKLSVYDESLILKRLLNRAGKENRPDDTEEVIQHRLEVYRAQTENCIQAYRGTMLTRIQADQPVFDVHLDIINTLHKMRNIHFP